MPEEEEKKEEKKEDEKTTEKKEEKKEDDKVILQVDMDCEGCKARVKKALKEIVGGEATFEVDMKGQKVTVRGMKMDPIKASEAVRKKSGKRTVLLHPDPKKLEEDQKKAAAAAAEAATNKESQAPPPPDPEVVVVLRVQMHCGACAKQIKRNLLKVDGVNYVNDDFASGTVTVKGKGIDPNKICERVRKRSGKRCEIVPPPPPPPTPPEEKKEEKPTEEKKEDEKKQIEETKKEEKPTTSSEKKEEEKKEEEVKEKKEEKVDEKKEEEKKEETTPTTTVEESNIDIKKYEYVPYRSIPGYVYPPQLFSDENPNACTIM